MTAPAAARRRLSEAALAGLPREVRRPGYDRRALATGIVHLGIGAFHRAHQAWYVERSLEEAGFGPWGICGVSLRHADMQARLAPQDGLYALATRHEERTEWRVIGAVHEVLVGPQDVEAVLARLTAPSTRIVSLTVTEKGYCLGADHRLAADHPDIRHDLEAPEAPRSAPGYLVAALARIRAAGGTPPTILSCDNLPSNGRTLKQAVVDLAALRGDDGLASWIERSVAMPCSMVDRIVPASSDADRAEAQAALGGVADEAVVTAEPFSQWVLERNFGGPMPDLAAVGVELVGEVAPYERMKLRLLNGSHSAIAYLGQLAGLEHVADVMADPALCAYVERLMAEIADAVPGIDPARIAEYRASLLARWRNPAIRHRTAQIAMDGSQKIPQRWIATLTALRQEGRRTPGLAFALAGWFRYLGGVGEQGPIVIAADPMAGMLTALCRPEAGSGPQDRVVAAMFDRSGLFPPALAQDRALRGAVAAALAAIADRGVREAARSLYWSS